MQAMNQNVVKAEIVAPIALDPVGTEKYASMVNFASANVVVQVNCGTSNAQTVITLKQATTIGGGGEKALAFTRAVKTADAAASNVTTELTGLSSSIRAGVATGSQIYQINVQGTDLDVAGGFKFIRADLSTSMTDAAFVAYADLYDARYTGGPGKFPASS